MIAGTPVVVLENCVTLEMHTTQALGGPAPDLFQWERKNQVYLAKVMVALVFQCSSKLKSDSIMCLIWYSLIIFYV